MLPALGDCAVHDVESDAVGDTFRIFVGHCHDERAADLPVVYVTDANGAFGLTVDTVRYLQMSGHLPSMLVVGIGYPVPLLRRALGPRCRDLTPTVTDAMHDSSGAVLPSGGAAAFLAFIVEELQPWIAARFPVGADVVYAGHSLGGLFGAYTLFERPATFRGYALASPSIWWDDREMLRREATYAAAHDDLDATVVVTVGGHETPAGRERAVEHLPAFARRPPLASPHDLVADAAAFVDALAGRGYPSLRVHHRTLADEHHTTVPPVAIGHGLRVLFGAPGADELVPPR